MWYLRLHRNDDEKVEIWETKNRKPIFLWGILHIDAFADDGDIWDALKDGKGILVSLKMEK